MIEAFIRHIRSKSLLNSEKTYLLACSGGLDSICLGTLLNETKISFEVAHVNFRLREEESDEDEAFVRNWAKSIGKTIHILQPDTISFAKENQLSIQMAAREIRYAWFEKLRIERKLDGIILAHQEDDQMETIFLNLLRGTGIEGIYGMAERRGWLIRPFLPFSRAEILSFAIQNGLMWREDSSNIKTNYKRNKLRIQALPALFEVAKDAKSNLQTSFSRLKDTGKAFTTLFEIWKKEHIKLEDGLQILLVSEITTLPGAASLLYFWLRPFGFNPGQSTEILESSIRGESGVIFESSAHLLNLDRDSLILAPKSAPFESIEINSNELEFSLPEGKYDLLKLEGHIDLDKNPQNAMLDLERLSFPLTIRTWEEGDRFIPLGMKNSKKISDFLIDLKIPLLKKKCIKVLVSEGEIAWVIGLRVAEWAKCTAATRRILYLKKR